jgi:hypothetical protein
VSNARPGSNRVHRTKAAVEHLASVRVHQLRYVKGATIGVPPVSGLLLRGSWDVLFGAVSRGAGSARSAGVGSRLGRDAKDVDLRVLRHGLKVLRGQVGRPRLRMADRAPLVEAACYLPRPSASSLWSRRARFLHRRSSGGSGGDSAKRPGRPRLSPRGTRARRGLACANPGSAVIT